MSFKVPKATEYEQVPVKPSKQKNITVTAKKQAVKAAADIHGAMLTWIVFKRLTRFMWTNKVAITVNLFMIENGYLLNHHFHIFAK